MSQHVDKQEDVVIGVYVDVLIVTNTIYILPFRLLPMTLVEGCYKGVWYYPSRKQ